MGFISSFIRCFCCDLEDEGQLSEQVPILFPTIHDASRNGALLSRRLLISSPDSDSSSDRSPDGVLFPPTCLNLNRDSIATDALHDQNVLKFQEYLDYLKDSSCSDSLQQELLISSDSFLSSKDSNLRGSFIQDLQVHELQCPLDSDTLINNSEIVESKKQDTCFLEELHFNERVEKKQEIRLLEDLHSKEPTDNVGKREKSVIKCVVAEERWINHYSSFQKILLVGEGDFSFSASLAKAFCSASNMTATSLNSREFLRKNYERAISNIKDLKNKECKVMHGVDATQMANNPSLKGVKFDRIIYNFPHAGFSKNESRESQISKHQQLVSQFLENAKEMVNETGEIHITHKTNGFHHEWNIELLASRQGLRLIEAARFQCTNYPGYRTKYGFGGDNDFNCNPSKTYKFGLVTTSTKKKKKKKKKTSDSKMI